MQLVQQGMAEKPAIVQLTDRVAGVFVMAVSGAAFATFAVWSVVDVGAAVDHTVALLIIACPCALGLATPLALAVAIGRAARRDILIKSGAALDRLSRPGTMLIDKTGTLTHGVMCVEAWYGEDGVLPTIAEVERHSTHPIARAIVEHYGAQATDNTGSPAVRDVRVETAGVTASTEYGRLCVGSRRYMRSNGIAIDRAWEERADQYEAQACTAVFAGCAGRVVGVLAIGDRLHADTKRSLDRLRAQGWKLKMLTGDSEAVAEQVAAAVGMPSADVQAGVTPEQKLLAAKQREGAGPLVMVGDGVNDAAALAAADVGVAVSGGAEASMVAADVYLARSGLAGLVELVEAATRCRRVMIRTLAFSLVYNAAAVGLAATGHISPLLAAILMPASSAAVLAIALYGQGIAPLSQATRSEPER